MNKEVEAKRGKILESTAQRLAYDDNQENYNTFGGWYSDIVHQTYLDRALFLLKELSSLGVMLVAEGELPKFPSTELMGMVQSVNYEEGYSDSQEDMAGYQLTHPLVEVKE